MDVVALYLSILKNMAEEAVRKSIENSTIKWENVNTTQLVRHVATTYDRSEIEKLGL